MMLEQISKNTSFELSAPPRVVVAIPAYNEDRFIGSVVLKARQFAHHVLVVDDGSSDLTSAVAEAAGARVVRHAQNLGKSAAVNTALDQALALTAEVVVLLDGDGQHHPRDIPALVVPIQAGLADIVVGSRFMRSSHHTRSQIPIWRQVGQHVLTAITNVLSGEPLTDSQSGFRALSSRAAAELRFGQPGFSVESEMQFQARERGLRVLEVPIAVTYAERPKRNPVAHGLQVLNGILRLIGQTRPLLFFGVPGLAALVLGIGLGLWVVERYEATEELAIGTALITVMLVISGTLAVFNGLVLHSVRGLLLQLPGERR